MRIARSLGWIALFGLGMACGGGDDNDDGGGPGLAISREAGEDQTGDIGTALGDSIVVLAMENGAPKVGETITWSAQGVAAEVSPATSVTDANGLAATAWVLGTDPGPQTARASRPGAGGSPVTFHALAIGGTGVTFGNTFFRSNHNGTSDRAIDTVTAGTTMVWTGTGGSHTVRSQGTPSFVSSGTLSGDGATFSRQFPTVGVYDYDCEIHGAQMVGRIVVIPAGP